MWAIFCVYSHRENTESACRNFLTIFAFLMDRIYPCTMHPCKGVQIKAGSHAKSCYARGWWMSWEVAGGDSVSASWRFDWRTDEWSMEAWNLIFTPRYIHYPQNHRFSLLVFLVTVVCWGKQTKKKKSALKYGFPRLCLYVPLNTGLDKTVIKVFSKKSIQQTDYTSLTNGSRGLISARIFCRFFLLKWNHYSIYSS